MEQTEIVWQGKVGTIPLRVGVPHAGRIIAEWDSPQGSRQKVAGSIEEFERTVLLQLLLSSGQSPSATEDVVAAVRKAQAERPRPAAPSPEKRRKNPKARQHRRSRRPPRRR